MIFRNNYPREDDISFFIDYSNARNTEKVCCYIYIDNKLYSSGKLNDVINELEEKSYVVGCTSDYLKIDLDLLYKYKTFVEAYNELNLIKEDYLNI